MKIKKLTSLLLSALLICSAFLGAAVTASAESVAVYSYVLTTPEPVNAFEGAVYYPSAALSVKSVTVYNNAGFYSDKNGKVSFNVSDISKNFDFSQGLAVVTIEFNVNGSYNPADIYGNMIELYSVATISTGNIPFDYKNIIDGETISRGHKDIDVPANSYADTKYSVVYNYKENPDTNSSFTKTIWAHSSNALQIAQNAGVPYISNPYYKNYSINDAEFTSESVVTANLKWDEKKYTVTLDGVEKGSYSYLETAVVETENENDFFVNGNRVARGNEFSFFVTTNTAVTTDASAGDIIDSAVLLNNALYICDNPASPADSLIKTELLTSVTSNDFERMGVVFAISSRSENDIKSAINTVGEGSQTVNRIHVHNSSVVTPNKSGQYQFIFAPYISASHEKVTDELTLYYRSYVVNKSGNITLSEEKQVNIANVLV